MQKLDLFGVIFGLVAALVALVVFSLMLLSTPETSPKVLVAVWLWSLPVLGIGAALGWVIARVVCLVTKTKGAVS